MLFKLNLKKWCVFEQVLSDAGDMQPSEINMGI